MAAIMKEDRAKVFTVNLVAVWWWSTLGFMIKNISEKNLNLLAKKLVYMIMIFQAINELYTPEVITLKVQAKYRVLSISNLYKPPKCASCYENKFSILAQPYAHGINL